MDRRIAVALTVFVISGGGPASGALEGSDAAPRVVRLGGSHPALSAGAQDFRGNPAAASVAPDRWEAGAGTTEPLGMEGLSEQSAWLGWSTAPWRGNSCGAQFAWRGFRADDLYRDDAAFARFGARRGDVGIGVGASALRVDYGEGDEGVALGGALGALARIGDVVLGGQVADPSSLRADPVWMREPVEAALGAALAPRGASWRTAATGAWREGDGWSWRFGQEIALPLGVDAGIGLALEPFLVACGAGWRLGWARLDVAAEGDPVLGWQTHVSLGFAIR